MCPGHTWIPILESQGFAILTCRMNGPRVTMEWIRDDGASAEVTPSEARVFHPDGARYDAVEMEFLKSLYHVSKPSVSVAVPA